MKKLIAIAALICLACAPKPLVINGTIVDGSMNTVTVATENGNVTFSILDADQSECNGMLVGCPVEITYRQPVDNGFARAIKIKTDAKYNTIVGRWIVQDSDPEEGFELSTDDSATAIGQAAIEYQTWALSGNTLTLTGQSIGEDQTVAFTEVLTIKEIDAQHLVLVSSAGAEKSYIHK